MNCLAHVNVKEDIIIKCKLEEMVKEFFKDYVVVWHDRNVNSQENQQYMAQLKKFCQVFTFTEWEKAAAAIKRTKEICHVITSGTNGELLVKEVSSSQNVVSVYVFCVNKDQHFEWAKMYEKVLCVESEIEKILEQIEKNLLKWYKQSSSLKLNLPAFAPIFNDSDKSEMNHLHRYLKMIPKFKNREQAKEDFLVLSRGIYSDKKNTKLIEDFEKTYIEYDKEVILRWYTQQSFLFKVINNSLRIATSDSIQYSRLLLKDLERAIKDQYDVKSKDFSGYLYRAAYLSEEEWRSLKENMNREIEMHGFLSVTKEKSIALKFMGVDPKEKIFITIIVPKGPNEEEQGFAEIEEFSRFPKEKEILFNVRSRFTVLATEDEYSPEKPHRHLVLLYGAQSFRKFVAEQNPTQEVQAQSCENTSCNHCKINIEKIAFKTIAEVEKEIHYCKKCVYEADTKDIAAPLLCIPIEKKTALAKVKGCLLMNSMKTEVEMSFYGYKCSRCEEKKQKRFFTCTDCSQKFCENCFENETNCLEAAHNIVLETSPFSFWCERMSENELNHLKYQNNIISENSDLFQQGGMYLESHEYTKATEYFTLYIHQNEAKGLDNNLANAYSNIGTIYERQGQYKKALEYYLKCLKIRKEISGEDHPDSGITYANLGAIYNNLGEYKNALEFHLRSLEIKRAAHKGNHIDIALSYFNIAQLYINLAKFTKALEFSLRALFMFKSVCGENHPHVAKTYGNIGGVFHSQGQYLKSLQNNLKSLEINKIVYGQNHPEVATAYNNIGMGYFCQKDFDTAIEYYMKCLEIKRLVFGENHTDVANALDNIGLAYQGKGEYKKALEFISKALDMRKAAYGENHPLVATSYNNIATVYNFQQEFKKALEYLLKALEIDKKVNGEINPDVSYSYFNIGTLYFNIGDVKKGLEFCLKSVEIDKEIFGENHPRLAESYQTLALIYESIGDHQKALEYHLKCLEINKNLHGENHADIALAYDKIAQIYKNLGEFQKVIEYWLKSLAIRKALFGENHAVIANSCFQIGVVYYKVGESMKGLEYHLRCIEICEKVYGNNHPQTMMFRNRILQFSSNL